MKGTPLITVTPTRNNLKMKGYCGDQHSSHPLAPKQKSDEWMHLSLFYTRMHREWLRYAKSTSQYSLVFSLKVRDDWGFQVYSLCRHDITRSDRQIGNSFFVLFLSAYKNFLIDVEHFIFQLELIKKAYFILN